MPWLPRAHLDHPLAAPRPIRDRLDRELRARLYGMACGLLLCALLSACQPDSRAVRDWTPDDHGHPPAPPLDQQAPPAEETGSEQRAAVALWTVTCAGCHGRDGRGGGPQRPPGAQMPDLSAGEFHATRSDQQLTDAIRHGKGMMPAFGKQLNDDGIRILLSVVRGFAAEADDRPTSEADSP